jgi:hypothetical protein
LRSLVKDKVDAQDAALRAHFETLQWNVEDESVLRLVYGDTPLEKVKHSWFDCIFFASDIDMSVPIVCSSALYFRAGTIFDPSRDILYAHFRREGMGSPPLLSANNQKGRPCKGYKPFW